ncbi:hypothetical protein ElyMa_001113800 [Elysia marginata]|uniref:Uncharacterized protein n=1 Tax=Elysia marginata TaxID=1093978 RepID=A0AAV4HVW4_9GAST|nr:hypothetical protein ElyMa_001113800 [Elysia marginata]
MASCELLRMIGIVAHFVCVILFLVAMGTVHWADVKHFSGEAGLWQYCNFHKNESISNRSMGVGLTPSSSTGSGFGQSSTPSTPVPSKSDEDKDEEEEECHSFGVIHIDGYLHIVRLLIILALFCFAYGFCKGTTIRVKIEYDPKFVRQHLGELLSLLGAGLALLALQIYKSSFKSDGVILPHLKGRRGPNGERDKDLLKLGWSTGLLESTMYLLIPVVILMLMPTLSEKCGWCNSIGVGHRRRSRNSSNSDTRFGALRRDFRSDPLGSLMRFVSWNGPSDSHPSASSAVQTSNGVELSISQRRVSSGSLSSEGSIFTISDSRTERGRVDNSEPAPRYEDLAPLPPSAPSLPNDASLMPPPPSYDDVLKGLYATTPPVGLSVIPPPPPPYTDSPPPVVSSALPALSALPPPASPSSSITSLSMPTTSDYHRPNAASAVDAPIAFQESSTIDDTLPSTSQSLSSSSSSISNETSVSNVSRTRSRSVSPASGRRSRSISPP